jgi:transcription initiation factor TFIIE subunit alpha
LEHLTTLISVSDDTLYNIAKVLGGDQGVEIIKILKENQDITVEDISAKTNIQINDVRKLLYKFYNHSLVTSKRFRDKETGWFIFQWRLQPELVEAYIQGMKQKIIKKLETRLEYEKTHEFYSCGNPTCQRITFEMAMETVFRCPTCDEPLRRLDNSACIEFLESKIKELKEDLNA